MKGEMLKDVLEVALIHFHALIIMVNNRDFTIDKNEL